MNIPPRRQQAVAAAVLRTANATDSGRYETCDDVVAAEAGVRSKRSLHDIYQTMSESGAAKVGRLTIKPDGKTRAVHPTPGHLLWKLAEAIAEEGRR